MQGAAALVDSVPPVFGAVIGEPTSLLPIRAHNGFIRVKLHAHGRAAHSSKAHLGQNAVVDASRAIVALADSLGEDLRTPWRPPAHRPGVADARRWCEAASLRTSCPTRAR